MASACPRSRKDLKLEHPHVGVGVARFPPVPNQQQDVIMELSNTFPARFGSFKYELFSCDEYYLYTFVSVENNNSQPLRSGLRGMFFEDPLTGNLDGWLLNGEDWTFKSVSIPSFQFSPSNAPNLVNAADNDQWECAHVRIVFDDVHCSRPIKDNQYSPGKNVRVWGYRSDGFSHVWEAGISGKFSLEGPPDESPTEQCGDVIVVDPNDENSGSETIWIETDDEDCYAYYYEEGANTLLCQFSAVILSLYILF